MYSICLQAKESGDWKLWAQNGLTLIEYTAFQHRLSFYPLPNILFAMHKLSFHSWLFMMMYGVDSTWNSWSKTRSKRSVFIWELIRDLRWVASDAGPQNSTFLGWFLIVLTAYTRKKQTVPTHTMHSKHNVSGNHSLWHVHYAVMDDPLWSPSAGPQEQMFPNAIACLRESCWFSITSFFV